MNFLLLISALFSALTGVGGVARGVQPVAAVAERVIAPAAVGQVVQATRRPVAAMPTRRALAGARVTAAAAPVASAPLYRQRRRE